MGVEVSLVGELCLKKIFSIILLFVNFFLDLADIILLIFSIGAEIKLTDISTNLNYLIVSD